MNTKLFQRLRKFPPPLIRLLARSPTGAALSDQDLVARGCPLPLVKSLPYLPSWDAVTIRDADVFLRACDADPMDTAWVRNVNRLTKPSTPTKWSWLRRAPHWAQLREILTVYARTLKL